MCLELGVVMVKKVITVRTNCSDRHAMLFVQETGVELLMTLVNVPE